MVPGNETIPVAPTGAQVVVGGPAGAGQSPVTGPSTNDRACESLNHLPAVALLSTWIGFSPAFSFSSTPGVPEYLQTKTLSPVVAREPLAPGPTSERATMLATASQPALRNIVARLRRRPLVSIDLLSPNWRGKARRE